MAHRGLGFPDRPDLERARQAGVDVDFLQTTTPDAAVTSGGAGAADRQNRRRREQAKFEALFTNVETQRFGGGATGSTFQMPAGLAPQGVAGGAQPAGRRGFNPTAPRPGANILNPSSAEALDVSSLLGDPVQAQSVRGAQFTRDVSALQPQTPEEQLNQQFTRARSRAEAGLQGRGILDSGEAVQQITDLEQARENALNPLPRPFGGRDLREPPTVEQSEPQPSQGITGRPLPRDIEAQAAEAGARGEVPEDIQRLQRAVEAARESRRRSGIAQQAVDAEFGAERPVPFGFGSVAPGLATSAASRARDAQNAALGGTPLLTGDAAARFAFEEAFGAEISQDLSGRTVEEIGTLAIQSWSRADAIDRQLKSAATRRGLGGGFDATRASALETARSRAVAVLEKQLDALKLKRSSAPRMRSSSGSGAMVRYERDLATKIARKLNAQSKFGIPAIEWIRSQMSTRDMERALSEMRGMANPEDWARQRATLAGIDPIVFEEQAATAEAGV